MRDVQLMVVREISASCKVDKPELERTMRLVDIESFDKYSHTHTMSLPAIEGIGTGDVVRVTVEFVHSAVEHELLRAAKVEGS